MAHRTREWCFSSDLHHCVSIIFSWLWHFYPLWKHINTNKYVLVRICANGRVLLVLCLFSLADKSCIFYTTAVLQQWCQRQTTVYELCDSSLLFPCEMVHEQYKPAHEEEVWINNRSRLVEPQAWLRSCTPFLQPDFPPIGIGVGLNYNNIMERGRCHQIRCHILCSL